MADGETTAERLRAAMPQGLSTAARLRQAMGGGQSTADKLRGAMGKGGGTADKLRAAMAGPPPSSPEAVAVAQRFGRLTNPSEVLAETEAAAQPLPMATDFQGKPFEQEEPGETAFRTRVRGLPEATARFGQLLFEAPGAQPGAGRAAARVGFETQGTPGGAMQRTVELAYPQGKSLLKRILKQASPASIYGLPPIEPAKGPTLQEIEAVAKQEPTVRSILAGVRHAQAASLELGKDRDDDAAYAARYMLENEVRQAVTKQIESEFRAQTALFNQHQFGRPTTPRFGPGRSAEGGIAPPSMPTKEQIEAEVQRQTTLNEIPGVHKPALTDEDVASEVWRIWKGAEAGRVEGFPRVPKLIADGLYQGGVIAATSGLAGLGVAGLAAQGVASTAITQSGRILGGTLQHYEVPEMIASGVMFAGTGHLGEMWAKAYLGKNLPRWQRVYGDAAPYVLKNRQELGTVLNGVQPAMASLAKLEAAAASRNTVGMLGSNELIAWAQEYAAAKENGSHDSPTLLEKLSHTLSMIASAEAFGGVKPPGEMHEWTTGKLQEFQQAILLAREAVLNQGLVKRMEALRGRNLAPADVAAKTLFKAKAQAARKFGPSREPSLHEPSIRVEAGTKEWDAWLGAMEAAKKTAQEAAASEGLMSERQALERIAGRAEPRDPWAEWVEPDIRTRRLSKQAEWELNQAASRQAKQKEMLDFAEHYSDRMREEEFKLGRHMTDPEAAKLYDQVVRERDPSKPKKLMPTPARKAEKFPVVSNAPLRMMLQTQGELVRVSLVGEASSPEVVAANKAAEGMQAATTVPGLTGSLRDLVDAAAAAGRKPGGDMTAAVFAKTVATATNYAFSKARAITAKARTLAEVVLAGGKVLVASYKSGIREMSVEAKGELLRQIRNGEVEVTKARRRVSQGEFPEASISVTLKDGRKIIIHDGETSEGRMAAFKAGLKVTNETGAFHVPFFGDKSRSPEQKMDENEAHRVMGDEAARGMIGSLGRGIEAAMRGITRSPTLAADIKNFLTGNYTTEELREKIRVAKVPFNDALRGILTAGMRLQYELQVFSGGDPHLFRQLESIGFTAVSAAERLHEHPDLAKWADPAVKKVVAAYKAFALANVELGKAGMQFDALPEARYLVRTIKDAKTNLPFMVTDEAQIQEGIKAGVLVEDFESLAIKKSDYDAGKYDRTIQYGELVGGIRFFEEDGYLAHFYNLANELAFNPTRMASLAGAKNIEQVTGLLGSNTLRNHTMKGRTRSGAEALSHDVKTDFRSTLRLMMLEHESFWKQAVMKTERDTFGANGDIRTADELRIGDDRVKAKIMDSIAAMDAQREDNNLLWSQLNQLPIQDRDIFFMAQLKATNRDLLKQREHALKSLTESGWVPLEGAHWGKPEHGGYQGMFMHRDMYNQLANPSGKVVLANRIFAAVHRMRKSVSTIGNFLRLSAGNNFSNLGIMRDIGANPFSLDGLKEFAAGTEHVLRSRGKKPLPPEDPLHKEWLAISHDSSIGFSGEIGAHPAEMLEQAKLAIERAKLAGNSIDLISAHVEKASAWIEDFQDNIPVYGHGRKYYRLSDEIAAYTAYRLLRRKGIHGSRPLSPDDAWEYIQGYFDLNSTTPAIQALANGLSFVRYRAKVAETFATRIMARRPTIPFTNTPIPIPILDTVIKGSPGSLASHAAVAARGALRIGLQTAEMLFPVYLARNYMKNALGISDDQWDRLMTRTNSMLPDGLKQLAALYAVPVWKEKNGEIAVFNLSKMTAGMTLLSYAFDRGEGVPWLWWMMNKNVLAGPILQSSLKLDYLGNKVPGGFAPSDENGRQEQWWPLITMFVPGIITQSAQAITKYLRDPYGEKSALAMALEQIGLPVKLADNPSAQVDEWLKALKKYEKAGILTSREYAEGGKEFVPVAKYAMTSAGINAAFVLEQYKRFQHFSPGGMKHWVHKQQMQMQQMGND